MTLRLPRLPAVFLPFLLVLSSSCTASFDAPDYLQLGEEGDDSSDDDSAVVVVDDDSAASSPLTVDPKGGEDDEWHILVSSDYGADNALEEWDPDWNVTWYVPADPFTTEGFYRYPDGRTVITQLGLPFNEYDIIEFTAEGEVTWNFDEAYGGGLMHPHGVEVTSQGHFLIADTDHNRVFEFNRDQEMYWSLGELPDGKEIRGPNGMDLLEIEGETRMVLTGRSFTKPIEAGFQFLMMYRYLGETDPPELLWIWPDSLRLDLLSIPHGPHLTEDGGATVCSSEHGEVIKVDRDGNEEWRLPPKGSAVTLDHPRDAIFLPNGNLLVADTWADRIIEVEDPFGAFTIVRERVLEGSFKLEVVECQGAQEDGGEGNCH